MHYRDRLRAARYAALADAEGFGEICFTIEAIGRRLLGKEATLGKYTDLVRNLSNRSLVLSHLAQEQPLLFTRFDALYEAVNAARNDVMHTGVYARHATTAAIELCIGLEEALMENNQHSRKTVADFMVKSPVLIEPWQPVAHARQLMLMHSFSFLPLQINDEWKLLSELAMAKFLYHNPKRKESLATPILEATKASRDKRLELLDAKTVKGSQHVGSLLEPANLQDHSNLWLVTDDLDRLVGVLSSFELM